MTRHCLTAPDFRGIIYDHYRRHGRQFPWRTTKNPYHIFVSEMMLQQTQAERVLPKYEEFLATFPDINTLASTGLKHVLEVWQGLGYNRRALHLLRAAQIIVSEHNGTIPRDIETLAGLPGLGRATAGAILAFGFNIPVVFIETNIRRVFIHFFFQGKDMVKDAEIIPVIACTLDKENPADWYNALMDYGSMLKKTEENPNKRSAHYKKQPSFEGSDRQIRGAILKLLLPEGRSGKTLRTLLPGYKKRVPLLLKQLSREGLIREEGGIYRIT